MLKKIIILSSFFLVFGQYALAADIGIIRNKTLTLVATDGTKTKYPNILAASESAILLANKRDSTHVNSTLSNEDTWSGDFLVDKSGSEYLKFFGRRVRIYTATSDLVAAIKVGEKNADRTLAVGDIFPDLPGQEILVCRRKTKHAKIQFFSYDESTGNVQEQLSFTPFQDLVDVGKEHGCGDINIAQVDGAAKIIVIRSTTAGYTNFDYLTLYIYNTDGQLENSISFGKDSTNTTYNIHFDVLDFSGDGIADDVAIINYPTMIVYNLSSGREVTARDLGDLSTDGYYTDYDIGNVDQIAGDDIVIMQSKKSNIFIWNVAGITNFGQLYPSAKVNRNRQIVVGDFSSVIE